MVEPLLSEQLERCRGKLPDPVEHPVWRALVTVYTRRLDRHISLNKRALGLIEAYTERSSGDEMRSLNAEQISLQRELEELKSWIYKAKSGLAALVADKEAVGDLLSSLGYSYSDVSRMLRRAQQLARGAPPARVHSWLWQSETVIHTQVNGTKPD